MRTQEELEEGMAFLRRAADQSSMHGDRESEVSAIMSYKVLCWAYGDNNEFADALSECEVIHKREGTTKVPRGRRKRRRGF